MYSYFFFPLCLIINTLFTFFCHLSFKWLFFLLSWYTANCLLWQLRKLSQGSLFKCLWLCIIAWWLWCLISQIKQHLYSHINEHEQKMKKEVFQPIVAEEYAKIAGHKFDLTCTIFLFLIALKNLFSVFLVAWALNKYISYRVVFFSQMTNLLKYDRHIFSK